MAPLKEDVGNQTRQAGGPVDLGVSVPLTASEEASSLPTNDFNVFSSFKKSWHFLHISHRYRMLNVKETLELIWSVIISQGRKQRPRKVKSEAHRCTGKTGISSFL